MNPTHPVTNESISIPEIALLITVTTTNAQEKQNHVRHDAITNTLSSEGTVALVRKLACAIRQRERAGRGTTVGATDALALPIDGHPLRGGPQR